MLAGRSLFGRCCRPLHKSFDVSRSAARTSTSSVPTFDQICECQDEQRLRNLAARAVEAAHKLEAALREKEKELAFKDDLIAAKHDLIAAKEEVIAATLREKEYVVAAILREKKNVVAAVLREKEGVVAEMKIREQMQDAATLQENGLFTARGVFEWATRRAHWQLYRGPQKELKSQVSKQFNATHTLMVLEGLDEHKRKLLDSPSYSWCKMLLDSKDGCEAENRPGPTAGYSLMNLYGTLSHEMHGHPWSGASVAVSSTLSAYERCVILKLIHEAGWSANIQESSS